MHSTRTRALAVLLSSQGRTIIEIATLLMVDEDTARCWINRWFIGKRENLEDEHRVGGPATRNAEEQAATIEMIKEHPSEPKVVINKINDQFGNTISRDTLRRDTASATHPRTVVIPMGPYPVTDGEATKSDLRQELGIPEHVKVFLSFGHIRDGKCLDVVLEAMVRCPDCHLIVAGREQSGGQKPASFYQELASRLGVSDRCHWFIDNIPNEEVWRYFRAADTLLLLYSKDFYSMSAVLNVNVQFRLPVLASAGGGPLLTAVEAYGLGLIIHDTNPATIASAIAENKQPVARWDDYVSDHSWETNATRVIEALRQASPHAR